MGLKAMLLLILLRYSLITRGIKLSREEDIELDQELQRLTKPAIETIQTTYGDIYNCVDFYQQPAFDNPAIKNHSCHSDQMNPSFILKGMNSKRFTSNFTTENIWVNGKGCPVGRVPVRQITKHDLFKAKQAARIYASNLNPQTAERPGVHFAVLHTPRIGVEVKYYGAGMFNGLYNPKLNHNSQYTSSQIKIQHGHELIIFGWTINPSYKDSQIRFFIYTQANGKRCFNDHCGVFVHTNPAIPLDLVFNRFTNKCGDRVTGVYFYVYRDENGRWVLKLGHEEVGYWPSKVFRELAEHGTYIEWGGEVYSPTHIASPEMGSGVAVEPNDGKCSAMNAYLTLLNEDRKVIPAMSLVKFEDINKFYQVKDLGNVGGEFKHVMYYGGGGGYIGT